MRFVNTIVLLLLLGLAVTAYDWISSFWRPRPAAVTKAPPTPSEEIDVNASVYSISRVTRGGGFVRYEVSFTRATNGQDKLPMYENLAESALQPLIGREVSFRCRRNVGSEQCYWLVSLSYQGTEIYRERPQRP